MVDHLYHLATAADWDARDDAYVPAPFAGEGFIHCSTAAQLAGVARRFFRGRERLVLLTIDPDRVTVPIRYENLEGGRESFPHVYGPLNLDAVAGCDVVHVDAAGTLRASDGTIVDPGGHEGLGNHGPG